MWRKSVLFVRYAYLSRYRRYWPYLPIAACDACSAKNEEGWKAREKSAKHAARLETVERMLAGLRQPWRDGEPVVAGWDVRRAQLVKDLEAERAKLLKDQ